MFQKLQNKVIGNKLFLPIVSFLVLIKLFSLLFTSHPFDFATYVYQSRSFFEYGINPVFYWNKGLPLLIVFYSQYLIYSFINLLFGLTPDNALLLHFLYKFPFFVFDIATALVLYKIIKLSFNARAARLIALVWLLNPLCFWVTDFQGQYVILATFFSTLSLYYLLKKSATKSLISLSLATSVYYYPVIFLPFYLLYCYKNYSQSSKTRFRNFLVNVVSPALVYLLSLLILYSPFILSKGSLSQLFHSLAHHSAPDAATALKGIQLPNYSLFKFPYYLFSGGKFPSSIDSPLYFKVIGLMTFVGLGIILVYSAARYLKYIRNKNSPDYDFGVLLIDLSSVTIIFLLLIGKLQSHYLLWILPLLLLIFFIKKQLSLVFFYFLISFFTLLTIWGSNNIGIFYLNTLPWGSINIFFGFSKYIEALGGFVILILLCFLLFLLIRIRSEHSIKPIVNKRLLTTCMLLSFIFFILIGSMNAKALIDYKRSEKRMKLAADSSVYNFKMISDGYTVNQYSKEREQLKVSDSGFEELKDNHLYKATGDLSSRTSPWYFYNYGIPTSASVYVDSSDKAEGNKSLQIRLARGGKAQISSSGNQDLRLIPVSERSKLKLGLSFKTQDFDSSDLVFGVRFYDSDRKLIPGSDIKLDEVKSNSVWRNNSYEFVPKAKSQYLEVIITAISGSNTTSARANIDAVSLEEIRDSYEVLLPNLRFVTNGPEIEQNIIETDAKKYFEFSFLFDGLKNYQRVETAEMNGCKKNIDSFATDEEMKILFDPSCYKKTGNQFKAMVVNYDQVNQPPTVNFKHKDILVSDQNRLIKALALPLALSINFGLIFLAGYTLRELMRRPKR